MKRLLLRRETLTALDEVELAELRGGTAVTSHLSCRTCVTVSRSYACVSEGPCMTDYCTRTLTCR